MADDRMDPTRPEEPGLAAARAAELAAWCDALEAELDASEQDSPDRLAETAPPPGLKERVLWSTRAEARRESVPVSIPAAPLPDRGLMTMVWALGVAASFMVAMAFGALWYATRADLGATRVNVAQLEGLLHEKTRELAEREHELAWLKDPRVQIALLKGLEGNPTAQAQLLWHPGTKQGILYVKGLPPLPLEKSYELWSFVDGQPVAAGTFDARPGDATVFAISRQESFGDKPTKFAVSIEPKGGVPKPTGAIVLLGDSL